MPIEAGSIREGVPKCSVEPGIRVREVLSAGKNGSPLHCFPRPLMLRWGIRMSPLRLWAIEWIMERYHITLDKDSGITNDPNDWAREHSRPRYIVDLLKRVVRVSMETIKIVNALPPLNERTPE